MWPYEVYMSPYCYIYYLHFLHTKKVEIEVTNVCNMAIASKVIYILDKDINSQIDV